ncbi:MAG: hypothetical protein IJY92_04040 [Alphaproteobacteria bacterium]|nr:hypothetical protein [Alphaproteobacteria bacterium]
MKILHTSSLFVISLTFLVLFLQWAITNAYEEVLLEENGIEKPFILNSRDAKIMPSDEKSSEALDVVRITENTLKINNSGVEKVYIKDDFEVFRYLSTNYPKEKTSKKVAILYISTGKYIRFWDNFYQAMEKYFLPNHEKTYFLFTDHDFLEVEDNVVKIHQDQLPWPYITFKRFHFFDAVKDQLKKFDYIYFLNGTMLPVDFVTEEIFPTDEQEIMVTLHPGYWRQNKFYLPYDRNPKSKAGISEYEGKYYVMGGFNGGTSKGFLKLISTLKRWSDTDMERKVMPKWHDESMLNRYVETYRQNGGTPLILLPEYAIPQVHTTYKLNELLPFTKMYILDKSKYGGHAFLRGEKQKKKKTQEVKNIKKKSSSLPNKPSVQKKDEEFEKAKGDMLNPMQNFLNIQKTLDF